MNAPGARIVLAAACLLAGACGSARRSENVVAPAHVTAAAPVRMVEAAFGDAAAPVEEDEIARGQRAFMRHCHACHPGGAAGLGPAINNRPLPRFLMKFQVRRGLGAMPAFDEHRLPDAELDALTAYLKTLRRGSVVSR